MICCSAIGQSHFESVDGTAESLNKQYLRMLRSQVLSETCCLKGQQTAMQSSPPAPAPQKLEDSLHFHHMLIEASS